jgi:diguanylate cyclase (GGDEF)-like protein
VLCDDRVAKRVKHTITTFLLSLGSGFNSATYFEHRLHVGLAHEAVNLSLSLYLCAYRALTQSVINHIPEAIKSDHQYYDGLVAFLYKINALDMTLAIETYHHSHVQNLEDSIDGMQVRQKQLQIQAITDSLTGMVNHDHVFQQLELILREAQAKQQPLCVVMADIDFFKKVNDNHGHQAGDSVLVDVARRIKSSLRDFDIVGRYGGEEFLLILQETPVETAVRIAERIRLKIADHPINLKDLILYVTMSLGVACARPDDDVETLVKRADGVLYDAKHSGRNRVTVAKNT